MQTLLPEHNPKVTFSVDTVRTDTTASNPVCLPENMETFFTSAIRTCLPVPGDYFTQCIFNDSLTLTPETLHGMMQNTPCVESLVTSAGPDTFTADVSPGVRECRYHRIFRVPLAISLCGSRPQTRNENRLLSSVFLSDRNSPFVVNGFTGDGAGEKRVVLITPSHALIPDTIRFPSSQPVPPFLPFPAFFLPPLACAVFRNRYVQL